MVIFILECSIRNDVSSTKMLRAGITGCILKPILICVRVKHEIFKALVRVVNAYDYDNIVFVEFTSNYV